MHKVVVVYSKFNFPEFNTHAMFAIAAFSKEKKNKTCHEAFLVLNSNLKNVKTKKLYITYCKAH